MKKNKIQVFEGTGRLEGKGRVAIAAGDGKERTLLGDRILLATGSKAAGLPGIDPDGRRVLTSDHILDSKSIPETLIILGAGAVGVEFASIFASFGTQVTLIELLPRIVPTEDEEVSRELARVFKKHGIAIRTSSRVRTATSVGQGVAIQVEDGQGKKETLKADLLLLAVGRRPRSKGLGLEKTQVEVEKGFIKTDDSMQTADPGVWAIGDVVGRAPLAHVASHEALVAVESMVGGKPPPINYDQIPWCTYCEPEVARVGLTESEARERGHAVKTGKFPFSALGRAMILGETSGFVKVVSEQKYGEVLGVHIIGPRATDLIGEGAALLRLEATNEEILHTVHAHPTLSEAVGEAALDVLGRALHR